MSEDSGCLEYDAKCLVAIYDDGVAGVVSPVNASATSGDHSVKVANVKLRDSKITLSLVANVLSVSYTDCMRSGYDKIKERLVSEYGQVTIEAHAYSAPESAKLEKFHKQIRTYSRDEKLRSLIICSPGHTQGHMRFPATVVGVHSVGLITSDNQIIGEAANGELKPTFLVRDEPFETNDKNGHPQVFRGTSAAVGYVAALAAVAFQNLNNRDDAVNSLFAALILISRKYHGSYLIDSERLLHDSLSVIEVPKKTTKRRVLDLIFVKGKGRDGRLAVVAQHSNTHHGWAPRDIAISATLNGGYSKTENNATNVFIDGSLEGQEIKIEITLEGVCDTVSIVASGGTAVLKSETSHLVKALDDLVIVGLSASHDASACVMINEKIATAVQLERLSRVKRDGAVFLQGDDAIDYCLSANGLTLEDVDYFAYNIQSLTPEYVGLGQPVSKGLNAFDPLGANAIYTSHHLCHAFAALSGSRFSYPTVVVADGSGGVTVGEHDLIMNGPAMAAYLHRGLGVDNIRPMLHTFSVYEFSPTGYKITHRECSPSFNTRSGSRSMGETYAAVSQYIFGSWQASGKLMGLAPYGNPEVHGNLVSKNEQGIYNFDYQWKLNHSKVIDPDAYRECADLAASVQKGLEWSLQSRFSLYVKGDAPIVFTGGIALNSVANHKIRKQFPAQDFYFFPAQHDAGVSIGAAVSAHFHITGKIINDAFDNDHLGYLYGRGDVSRALNRYSNLIKYRPIHTDEIARKLAGGDVLGFFSLEKGSEFGPRALGARSILADPRHLKTWAFINRWVKFREDFRPFAPMIAKEHVGQYFEEEGDYPYMLEVIHVRHAYRDQLSAITHVDGTARVQTVDKSDNASLHRLLISFMNVAEFPILLNTSFNVRGQPIVETPCQAIEMLLSTHLSGVVMGDYLLELKNSVETLTGEDVLNLSPGTKIISERTSTSLKRKMIVGHQGKTVGIPNSLYRILESIDGERNIASLSGGDVSALEPEVLEKLSRFVRLKYLNASGR